MTSNDIDDNAYMQMVEAKRARNAQMIEDLGLSSRLMSKKTSSPRNNKTTKTTTTTAPLRRSRRVQKETPLFAEGLQDEALLNDGESTRTPKKKRRRSTSPATTAKRRPPRIVSPSAVEELDLPAWFAKLEHYLERVDVVSAANARSVLKQVEKLVTGRGITYGRWPKHVVFRAADTKALCDDLPSVDLEALLNEAVDYEEEYGRDLGNGWLMRHPIKKLYHFQQWLLRKDKKTKKSSTQADEGDDGTESS